MRTGPASRAAILCMDESQIKLNENTIVILKSITPFSQAATGRLPRRRSSLPAPPSHYQVPQGEIWLRNKHEKFRFELETPAVTATIRGTELNIKVQRNGTTRSSLLEGNVCLANPQGEVCLRPGEEGYAIPGQKPHQAGAGATHGRGAVGALLSRASSATGTCPSRPCPGEFRTPPGPPAAGLLDPGRGGRL